jgi:hypothetical protein
VPDPESQASFQNTLGYKRKLEMAVNGWLDWNNGKTERPTSG